MIEAEENTSFVFGHKKLKNLKDLIDVLENKEFESIAKGHVTDEKNDFANWIKHVLKDEELAYEVSQEKEINSILDILKKKIEKVEIRKVAEMSETQKVSEHAQKLKISDTRVEELIKNPDFLKKEENTHQHNKDESKKDVDSHLAKEVSHHKAILKHAEPRHFCPKFFDCMRKEFLFGFTLGIIVGIVIAVFVKIGAI